MNKIRIAIIGCGYWGHNLARNFAELENAELVAVCDFNLNALARIKRRFPSAELMHDYRQVFGSSRIDAVVIATPVSTHYPLALQALRAQKHVLVEQPLATSSRQATDLLEVAEKHHVVLMVDQTFVYTAAVRHMKALVVSGEMGDLLYFDSARISLGVVQSETNVVWDLAPHDFSIMDYLFSERPIAISAVGVRHCGHAFENMAYVTAYFASKLIAHFHVNWLAPVKVRQIILGGTKKTTVYDDLESTEKLRIYDTGILMDPIGDARKQKGGYRNGDIVVPNLDTTEALRIMAGEFIQSITQKKNSVSDGSAGYRVVRLLQAAQRSMELHGELIELADLSACRRSRTESPPSLDITGSSTTQINPLAYRLVTPGGNNEPN